MTEWQKIDTAPEKVRVETKIDDALGCRNQQSLIRKGRLWWTEDEAMYVYYVSTHWRLPPPPEKST